METGKSKQGLFKQQQKIIATEKHHMIVLILKNTWGHS